MESYSVLPTTPLQHDLTIALNGETVQSKSLGRSPDGPSTQAPAETSHFHPDEEVYLIQPIPQMRLQAGKPWKTRQSKKNIKAALSHSRRRLRLEKQRMTCLPNEVRPRSRLGGSAPLAQHCRTKTCVLARDDGELPLIIKNPWATASEVVTIILDKHQVASRECSETPKPTSNYCLSCEEKVHWWLSTLTNSQEAELYDPATNLADF